MARISKNAELSYSLDGIPCSSPENIEDTEIIADFSNDNVQANITAKNWSFYNEDAKRILDYIDSGNKYKGMPFKITAYNNITTLVTADLLLDLTTENFANKWEDERRVVVDIVKKNGLNQLFEGLKTNSLAYLEDQSVFTQSDYQICEYLVEKKINIIEELTSSLIGYMMAKELISQIKLISDTISDGVQETASGILGAVAAAIGFALKLIAQVAYAASILILIIDIGKKMMNTFLPPIREHKTLNIHLALNKICGYLGYDFNTSIDLLNSLYYLPSNPQLNKPKLAEFLTVNKGTNSGIPRATDVQYSCEAFFNEIKKQFNGAFAIVDGVVQFHPKGSGYWTNQSNYIIKGVKPSSFNDNANDLQASKLLTFSYDLNDEYTIDDQTGRLLEIQTRQSGNVDQKTNMIKGFEEINFNVCLGTRKDSLTPIEENLQEVGEKIDKLINFFGGNSNLSGKVKNRVGMLIQSSNWHSLPKILVLEGKKINFNHKKIYSTEVLYDNYHYYSSFVLNNFGGQKKIIRDKRIPFGMEDFIMLTNNSYARDENGVNYRIDSFKWKLKKDFAVANYRTNYIFATNLEETKIIPK
tara:strand:- start:17716 stop:19473 length:1758 start_codon:yes stop_codon:yes gene_type:complete